jgi:hypothetical protein
VNRIATPSSGWPMSMRRPTHSMRMIWTPIDNDYGISEGVSMSMRSQPMNKNALVRS